MTFNTFHCISHSEAIAILADANTATAHIHNTSPIRNFKDEEKKNNKIIKTDFFFTQVRKEIK